jgi:membrane associated rhomboid family serine protease
VAVVFARYLAVLGVAIGGLDVVLAKAWVGAVCGLGAGAWFAILSVLIRRGGHRRSAQPEKDPHA